MAHVEASDEYATVEVANIGGIDRTNVALEHGVTILAGKNATNRTSFLKAVMAACGSENTSIKADADEGEVTLSIGDETYTRTLRKENGIVRFDGDPYLEDPTPADLFAFLLENNEARQAVTRSEDLREIIMRPVDTAALEREIRDLETERDRIDEEISDLEEMKQQLPNLEERRRELEQQIEAETTALTEQRAEIEALDAELEETRDEKAELEAKIDELGDVRTELRTVEERTDSEEQSIERLQEERADLRATLEEFDEVPDERIREIEQEVQRLRGRVQEIESTVGDLQSVIQFNDTFLDDDKPEIIKNVSVDSSDDGNTPTDQLVDDQVVCWTCGNDVPEEDIEATLDQLREFYSDKMNDRKAIEDEIDELEQEKEELEQHRRSFERNQEKLDDVGAEIDRRESTVRELRERQDELDEEVDELKAEIDRLEADERSEIIDAHDEATQIEFELEQLEEDLDDVESEIAEIEAALEGHDELESRRDDVQEQLAEQRTHVEDLQADAVQNFNTHMEDILDRLAYKNIERVWIERVRPAGRDRTSGATDDRFELHVVRSSESGAVFEDTVDNLSESEREVIGLVFALAGFIVHEVHDTVPFMCLDSIEAIDADRIEALVEYFDQFANFLVVALLQEDAQALDGEYDRITEI